MYSFCKLAFLPWMVSTLMLYIMISTSIPTITLVDCKENIAKEHIEVQSLPLGRKVSSHDKRENMTDSSSDNGGNVSMNVGLKDEEVDFLEWVRYVASKKHEDWSWDEEDGSGETNGSIITVSKTDTQAQFASVQAAIDSIPNHNTHRVTIQIDAGIYKEKVEVPSSKPYITFLGAGSDSTTITWHDTSSSSGSTFKSASVAVNSKYFIARDISFKNSAPAPPPGAKGKQAVALRISGDKAAFYNCKFYGAQDTLYDQAGRHYFQNCFIQGSIDFIFGDGLSFYERCQLNSIATRFGSLTAQNRHKPSENTGFSFVNCKVTGSGTIYLGRTWGPFSRVVFIATYIDDIIVPKGWDDWGNSHNQKTAFYGEYNCIGPGANTKNRVAWSYQLTPTQAAPFQSLSFVDGASWVQS